MFSILASFRKREYTFPFDTHLVRLDMVSRFLNINNSVRKDISYESNKFVAFGLNLEYSSF